MQRYLWPILLVLLGGALSQRLDVPVEKYTLPNGLTVILHQDRSLPTVAVNLWFRVGSKDEPDRRSGFAHLFEHLMFMGTQNAPNFDQVMEGVGGSNNASTGADRTNYYSSGPSSALPTLLWLEADRLANLGRNIDQKKLDLQRNVVLNELRQNTIEQPYGQAYDAITTLMYPKDHPYHNPVIGTPEDLKAASVEDVQRFFATYYMPNNGALVVAGDFDPKQVKPLIAQLFKDIPRGSDVPRKAIPNPAFRGIKRFSFADKVPAAKVMMVWHSPPFTQKGDAELDLAASLLAKGVSSQLYQDLVEGGLATDVQAYQQSQLLGSLFNVEATAAEGVSADKLEAALDKSLKAFLQKPVRQADLKRVIAQYETALLTRLQSPDDKADLLNSYNFFYGNPNSFERDLERYRKATPQSVQATLRQVMDLNARLVLRVLPTPARPDAELSIPRPKDSSSSSFNLPKPNELSLGNGLKAFYWQRSNLPLMYLAAYVKGGSGREGAQNAGRATLLNAMLARGAGPRDAQTFEKALDELGASLKAAANVEYSQVSLSVSARNFKPALALYADALTRPSFKPEEWKNVQAETVAGLKESYADPENTARAVGNREYFGAAHPYGHPATPQSAAQVKLDEALAEYRATFQPQNTVIFAAGSLSPAAFKNQLEAALGNWKNTAAALPAPSFPAPKNTAQRLVIVDRPGSTQTAIRFVMPALKSSDANANLLASINTILGGSFTSRLNQNLREDKGYTYGAGSGLRQTPNFGILIAAAAVETSVTGAALKEFLAEFDRLKSGDISPQEASKTAATRRNDIISGLATLEGLVGTAIGLYTQQKPFSSLEQTLSQLARYSADDLNQLVPQAIPLEQGVIVLVGDKAKILPQLEELNLPTPEEVKF